MDSKANLGSNNNDDSEWTILSKQNDYNNGGQVEDQGGSSVIKDANSKPVILMNDPTTAI